MKKSILKLDRDIKRGDKFPRAKYVGCNVEGDNSIHHFVFNEELVNISDEFLIKKTQKKTQKK